MKDYTQDHKDLNYRFIKEIPSNTKARAWHVKINDENYHIVCTPLPRLYEVIFAYEANRSGKVKDYEKKLICFKGNDLNEGVEELISVLKGSPSREFHKIPQVF